MSNQESERPVTNMTRPSRSSREASIGPQQSTLRWQNIDTAICLYLLEHCSTKLASVRTVILCRTTEDLDLYSLGRVQQPQYSAIDTEIKDTRNAAAEQLQ